MEVDTRRNLHEDRISDCRSFGSNYHPSSQTRKMSIGIMIDSLANKRPGTTNGERVEVRNTEQGNSVAVKNKDKCVMDVNQGKQTEAPEQPTSPWVTTRSFYQKAPRSEAVVQGVKETCNLPSTNGRRNKHRMGNDARVTHSVQFFKNQTPILHSSDGKQETFDGLTYKRKGSKDGNSQGVEKCTFSTAQEVLVSDKAAIGDRTGEGRTETLRMKLQEILGTVSSPKTQPLETDANTLKPDQVQAQKNDAAPPLVHNSDTIETDSENLDLSPKRPVTRSLRPRRGLTRKPEKKKSGPFSSCKQTLPEKNEYFFAEGLFGKRDADHGNSSMSTRNKKGLKKSCSVKPPKTYVTENNNASGVLGKRGMDINCAPPTSTEKKGQRKSFSNKPHNTRAAEKNEDEVEVVTHRSGTSLFAERTSSPSNKSQSFSPQNKTKYPEPKTGNEERYCHQSPRADFHPSQQTKRTMRSEDFNSPKVQKPGGPQEERNGPSLENVEDPPDDLQSPTLKMNTPTPSPVSTPMPNYTNQGPRSPPLVEKGFTVKNIRSFRTLQTSKADSDASTAETESSDDAAEFEDSPCINPSPLKGNDDSENGPSESSSEEKDSESSEEDHIEGDSFSQETATAKMSKFMFGQTDGLHNRDEKFNPTPPSPKGIGVSDWTQEPRPSEQDQDELARVATLFALCLENFKNKMKLATRKKSSEILMSVSEEINLQMQSAESQIQSDLGKLTSISKQKRKRIETRFQEQQEQLKTIHDKFIQDIHQHLEDCNTTLEELQEHQIEWKGAVKKQKVSHQKLLVQVEEAVETQLKDAQRNISAVHKLAREKMLMLSHVVTECLNETVS